MLCAATSEHRNLRMYKRGPQPWPRPSPSISRMIGPSRKAIVNHSTGHHPFPCSQTVHSFHRASPTHTQVMIRHSRI